MKCCRACTYSTTMKAATCLLANKRRTHPYPYEVYIYRRERCQQPSSAPGRSVRLICDAVPVACFIVFTPRAGRSWSTVDHTLWFFPCLCDKLRRICISTVQIQPWKDVFRAYADHKYTGSHPATWPTAVDHQYREHMT